MSGAWAPNFQHPAVNSTEVGALSPGPTQKVEWGSVGSISSLCSEQPTPSAVEKTQKKLQREITARTLGNLTSSGPDKDAAGGSPTITQQDPMGPSRDRHPHPHPRPLPASLEKSFSLPPPLSYKRLVQESMTERM